MGGHSGLAGWVAADRSDELIGLELMGREPIGGGGGGMGEELIGPRIATLLK